MCEICFTILQRKSRVGNTWKMESIMSLIVEATYWVPGEYYSSLKKLNENVEGAIKVRNIVLWEPLMKDFSESEKVFMRTWHLNWDLKNESLLSGGQEQDELENEIGQCGFSKESEPESKMNNPGVHCLTLEVWLSSSLLIAPFQRKLKLCWEES